MLNHQEQNDDMTRGLVNNSKKRSDEENKKLEKDLSKIECYAFGKTGCYRNKCVSVEQKKDDANENEEQ